MIIRKIRRGNPSQKVIDEAISVMEGGGVVIYPTDTIYGLGVNALDRESVRKLFRIKGRAPDKPVSICVSKVSEIPRFSKPSEHAMEIIRGILPGPYTVLLEKKDLVPDILTGGSSKVGVRVPDDEVCRRISAKFPVTATSANISGKQPSGKTNDIIEDLKVDLMLDAGECDSTEPSTVVDLTAEPPAVLRIGRGDPEVIYRIFRCIR
ncbi:L-threonylcarbamoyladenylate synthase [Methanothermobacter sp.]|uniref:L-threonylcarbamoyladenylate synthase n=1 Tax=Methanothermobacter sp. TaxID=1884223 RepID=UPI0026318A7F|nr:L-threonylcarbamoyladenylate synthase [Methanothermobacter sp.]MDI9615410.1 L-threonylcarbamoyladenylate synthase [Methanothermobacter sp.]